VPCWHADARVVVGDVIDCSETLALANKAGGKAVATFLDVRSFDLAKAMADTAMSSFGRAL
jgi:hypothetical protein